jgi:hypothetical protein
LNVNNNNNNNNNNNSMNNEVCGACDMYGGQEECIQSCGWKTEGKRTLEDVNIDDNVILKQISNK